MEEIRQAECPNLPERSCLRVTVHRLPAEDRVTEKNAEHAAARTLMEALSSERVFHRFGG